jgi:hypothetical protein
MPAGEHIYARPLYHRRTDPPSLKRYCRTVEESDWQNSRHALVDCKRHLEETRPKLIGLTRRFLPYILIDVGFAQTVGQLHQ